MRLELATYPVRRVELAGLTRWRDGVLSVDADELVALALSDRRVRAAAVDVVHPGESARVVNVHDVWLPQVKATGPGQVYPGVCGRPVTTVGSGRTNRLGGVGLVECLDRDGELGPGRAESRGGSYFDTSGPGAVTPYSQLASVCLTLQIEPGLSDEDWDEAKRAAALRVVDRLAATTLGQEPTEVEVFDLDAGAARALPGVVFVSHLRSAEHRVGPRSAIGTAVYGVTRLSAPWLLSPTEVMDGAITRKTSWLQASNPIVFDLARRHGRDVNFLGCIVSRTNWTAEREKQLSALRVAEMAALLGATGAIVTVDVRGNRFVEAVLGVQALEQRGIKTVLCTVEEPNEDGQAPPLIFSTPEIVSAVSCGDSEVPGPFPAVERVLGVLEGGAEWHAQRPGEGGGHIARYWVDYYGWGRVGCVDW